MSTMPPRNSHHPADRRTGGNRLACMQQALIDGIAAGDLATSESAIAEMRLALRAAAASPQARTALDALRELTQELRDPRRFYARQTTQTA